VSDFLLKAPWRIFDPMAQFLSLDLHLSVLGLLISVVLFACLLVIWYGLPALAIGYLICKGYLFYYRVIAGRPFRLTADIYQVVSASAAVLFSLEFAWSVMRDVQRGWTIPMSRGARQPVFYSTDPKWFVATLVLDAVQVAALWGMLTALLRRLVVDFNPTKPEPAPGSPAPPSPPRAAPMARTDDRGAPPP